MYVLLHTTSKLIINVVLHVDKQQKMISSYTKKKEEKMIKVPLSHLNLYIVTRGAEVKTFLITPKRKRTCTQQCPTSERFFYIEHSPANSVYYCVHKPDEKIEEMIGISAIIYVFY